MRQALSETWLVFPVEVWPNIGASLAAGVTDEQRLDIGEPNIVGRLIAAACGRVAALVVRQQAATPFLRSWRNVIFVRGRGP